MSSYSFSFNSILKPTVAGITASLLNRYVLDERNMMRNVVFGASSAVAIAFATLTEPTFEKTFDDDGSFKVGKSAAGRIYEIGAGSVGAWAFSKYIADNDPFGTTPIKTIAVVAASDILAETVMAIAKYN